MDSKKKMYIIIIAVAAAVLLGLIIWAICLSVNRPADGTEPTGNELETTLQSAEDTTGESQTDAADAQPVDTTAETADATETTGTDETKSDGSSDGNSASGNDNKSDNKPDNAPDNEPDDEPDDKPDNSGNNTKPAATEPAVPNEYPYTLTYQEYLDMTEKEQIAFYKLFANHNEFKKWRTAAKKEYEENKIEIEIGSDGKIDLGQITGKN